MPKNATRQASLPGYDLGDYIRESIVFLQEHEPEQLCDVITIARSVGAIGHVLRLIPRMPRMSRVALSTAGREEQPGDSAPVTPHAFVDRRCPQCDGEGLLPGGRECPRCEGYGSVGSYEPVSDMPRRNPTPFSMALRSTREGRNLSLRDLALHLNMSVSRLSEIESGLNAQTPDEEKAIREWMEAQDAE